MKALFPLGNVPPITLIWQKILESYEGKTEAVK